MIYNKSEYRVKFYQDDKDSIPIIEYLDKISKKEKAKNIEVY